MELIKVIQTKRPELNESTIYRIHSLWNNYRKQGNGIEFLFSFETEYQKYRNNVEQVNAMIDQDDNEYEYDYD